MVRKLVAFALYQPLFLVLVTLLFVGAGVVAFRSLPVEAFPKKRLAANVASESAILIAPPWADELLSASFRVNVQPAIEIAELPVLSIAPPIPVFSARFELNVHARNTAWVPAVMALTAPPRPPVATFCSN